jgi:hypothetical protein
MLKSFSTRLAIAKFANDLQSRSSYDMALRLNAELTTSCQHLRKQMMAWPKDESGVAGVSDFQLRTAELAIHRFFLAIHLPLLGPSLTDPTFYFSRKMCIDTALKLSQLAHLLGPASAHSTDGDFDRLITSAAGPYRTAVFQGILIIGLELVTRKEEQIRKGDGSVALGEAEMRSVLDAAVDWTASVIRSGETNCKGHAAVVALLAQFDGLQAGFQEAELDDKIAAQAKTAFLRCHDILLSAANLPAGNGDVHLQDEGLPLNPFEDDPMDFLKDWEQIVS